VIIALSTVISIIVIHVLQLFKDLSVVMSSTDVEHHTIAEHLVLYSCLALLNTSAVAQSVCESYLSLSLQSSAVEQVLDILMDILS